MGESVTECYTKQLFTAATFGGPNVLIGDSLVEIPCPKGLSGIWYKYRRLVIDGQLPLCLQSQNTLAHTGYLRYLPVFV